PELRQPLRIGIWKRPEQQRTQQRKDGSIGADSQRESTDGCQNKAGVPPKHSHRGPCVLADESNPTHWLPPYFPGFVPIPVKDGLNPFHSSSKPHWRTF